MLNIIVLVSGGGTNLQALINAESYGIIQHGRISKVISSRSDAKALARAQQADIETAVVPRKDFENDKTFNEALLKEIDKAKPDLIVLAGFMHILTEDIIKKYDKKILNVHPSLIPAFSGKGFYGLKVHEAALERGVKITGATVHFVNEIPDGGEIIVQKAVEVLPDDTPETLQRRVMEVAEWNILPEAVAKLCKERDK